MGREYTRGTTHIQSVTQTDYSYFCLMRSIHPLNWFNQRTVPVIETFVGSSNAEIHPAASSRLSPHPVLLRNFSAKLLTHLHRQKEYGLIVHFSIIFVKKFLSFYANRDQSEPYPLTHITQNSIPWSHGILFAHVWIAGLGMLGIPREPYSIYVMPLWHLRLLFYTKCFCQKKSVNENRPHWHTHYLPASFFILSKSE